MYVHVHVYLYIEDDEYRITSVASFPLSLQYVENLMTWIEKQIGNEEIFPVQIGESPLLWNPRSLPTNGKPTNLHSWILNSEGNWNRDVWGQELS